MENPVYDLILGNIPGAMEPSEVDWRCSGSIMESRHQEETHVVQTRGPKARERVPKKAMKTVTGIKDVTVDDIKQGQDADVTLTSVKARVVAGNKKTSKKGGEDWFKKVME